MSHTLHRQGPVKDLEHDFAVLSRTASGINKAGSQPMLREFVKCAFHHDPVNLGNHNGNMHAYDETDIVEKITEGRGSNVIFSEKESVIGFIKELQQINYTISVTCSGLEDSVREISDACGLKIHSVNMSLGVFGNTAKLPRKEILEITTMCGHHQVSPLLVEEMVKRVKEKRMTSHEAAKNLVRPCPCGIVNSQRAKEIVEKLAAE